MTQSAGPTIFISSTILDLRDLRSALKFWLEENGYGVRASDAHDFPHALDRESMDAAVASIEGCDFYILLIGYRYGSVIAEDGVSITRAELRRARELQRSTGRPLPVYFGREEVVTLARGGGKPPVGRSDNWPAIADFIEEVTSSPEARDANWLHSFSTFRDITDVLRANLKITGPLARRALEANLVWEVVANARELLYLEGDYVGSKANRLPVDHVPVPPAGNDDIRIDHVGAFWIVMFRMSLPRLATLSRTALDQAIVSGLFLDYDATSGRMFVGTTQQLLLDFRHNIERLQALTDNLGANDLVIRDVGLAAAAGRNREDCWLSPTTLLYLHSARNSMENALRVMVVLYRHLTALDSTLGPPSLIPDNPTHAAPSGRREDPNESEATAWLERATLPPPG